MPKWLLPRYKHRVIVMEAMIVLSLGSTVPHVSNAQVQQGWRLIGPIASKLAPYAAKTWGAFTLSSGKLVISRTVTFMGVEFRGGEVPVYKLAAGAYATVYCAGHDCVEKVEQDDVGEIVDQGGGSTTYNIFFECSVSPCLVYYQEA